MSKCSIVLQFYSPLVIFVVISDGKSRLEKDCSQILLRKGYLKIINTLWASNNRFGTVIDNHQFSKCWKCALVACVLFLAGPSSHVLHHSLALHNKLPLNVRIKNQLERLQFLRQKRAECKRRLASKNQCLIVVSSPLTLIDSAREKKFLDRNHAYETP